METAPEAERPSSGRSFVSVCTYTTRIYVPSSLIILLQEWNHLMMCVLLGVAALGFPLYDRYDIPDGPFADL